MLAAYGFELILDLDHTSISLSRQDLEFRLLLGQQVQLALRAYSLHLRVHEVALRFLAFDANELYLLVCAL